MPFLASANLILGGAKLDTYMKRLAFAATLLLFLTSCTGGELGKRHETPDLEQLRLTKFDYKRKTPFEDYLKQISGYRERIIRAYYKSKGGSEHEKIIEAGDPFEILPAPGCGSADGEKVKNGVLLIHGLTDTPFVMRDIGRHFQSKCFLVRAILLPGHGTVPGDLLEVTFEDWIDAVRYGINSFSNRVENLYVVGFSTGGAVALYHGLEQGIRKKPIRGLVLLSPAVRVKSRYGWIANWHRIYSWAYPKGAWLSIFQDADYAKYESFSKNAGDQIHLLTKELGSTKEGDRLSIPMFMALSNDDTTIDPKAALEFFRSTKNPNNRFILYKKTPLGDDLDRRVLHRRSEYKDENILNFAHISIPVSPDNPHYGRKGDYRNCLHYFRKDAERFRSCRSSGANMKYGELTKSNLAQYTLGRLTYNSDFENLLEAIGSFVKNLN